MSKSIPRQKPVFKQIKLKKLNKLPSWVASPVRSLVDGRTLPLVLPLLRRLLNKPPSPVGSQVRASWSLKLEENVCTSVLKVQCPEIFDFRKQKGFLKTALLSSLCNSALSRTALVINYNKNKIKLLLISAVPDREENYNYLCEFANFVPNRLVERGHMESNYLNDLDTVLQTFKYLAVSKVNNDIYFCYLLRSSF